MSEACFSVLGLFDSAQALVDAIPLVTRGTEARLEAYTPYPVRGIDKVLCRRRSPVAGMVMVMGILGALTGLGFEIWASAVDYPLVTAGKPPWSWQAFVPIMFEVTVLFATFTAGLGMLLLLNRMPMFRHPMLRSRSMPLITKDRFALAVEAEGQLLDVEKIGSLLRAAGATSVEVVEVPAPPGPVSPNFVLMAFTVIVISCAAAGYVTYWAIKLFPVSAPMVHMLEQPRLDPQRASSFFSDGFGMRLPVAGTVARGYLPYLVTTEDEAAVLNNPLPRTAAVLNAGRQGFLTYCVPCHGVLGNGQPTLTAAYGAKPANLMAQAIREYPDGKIYHVITAGKNAMPRYSWELNQDQRWAVVNYVRALQRSQHALDSDIPKEVR
jgi:mono/diheme cytochrome c family protein